MTSLIQKTALRKIVIIFLLVIIAAILFWSSVSIQSFFSEAIRGVEGYAAQKEALAIAVFLVAAMLSAMLSPFSSLPFIPVAIALWGNFLTGVLLLVGWVAGEILTYVIGYYAVYPFVRRFTSLFEKIKYYQDRIPKKAEFWLILLFRFAIPAEIPGYVLGSARYDFGKYFLATFLAELPFAFISSYASDALISNRPVMFLSLVIPAFLGMVVAFYFFNKKLRGI